MTRDDSKLAYYSGWDIDQLVASAVVNASTGLTILYPYTGNVPLYELQFQPTGAAVWYAVGMSSTDGTLANRFTFYGANIGGNISAVTTTSGKVRYFIWSDKVLN